MALENHNNISRRDRFHQQAFYYLCMLLVFLIPVFMRILPLVIALMALNWLIEGSYLRIVPMLRHDKKRLWLLSFSLIYILYAIGLLYSDNMIYGRFDIQVKLSLLVFPLIFSTTGKDFLTSKTIRILLQSFVAGCLIGSFLFIGHAWYNAIHRGLSASFYYTNLSWFSHPSYLAMYFSFSISILAFFLIEKWEELSRLISATYILLLFYFFIFILLLSSKAGILTLTATGVFWIIILAFSKHQWSIALVTTLIVIASFYTGLKIFPFASERIVQAQQSIQADNEHKADTAIKSTSDRISIWKASTKILRKNFLFGVGTGDVKDELIEEYKKEHNAEGLLKQLNAHNQYLQTFITLGIIGFLFLVFMLIIPAWMAIRHEQYLYFSFLLIFSLNMAVESMLETQAGVIFYAFFNAFLFAGMYFLPVPASSISGTKIKQTG